ncbi:MOSC domain-containing protein, partial [Bacillus mycoides]|uniref:MOSC domain-containing protein n=1 Tax=Bacillus mycoides TaxID=1405 RepID=UPI0011A6F64B
GFLTHGVADLSFHGRPHRPVCLYPHQHYPLSHQQFQTLLPPSTFRENITLTNMLQHHLCIRDTYQLGQAIIQI